MGRPHFPTPAAARATLRVLLAVLLALGQLGLVRGQDEHRLKARFVELVCRFITWPPGALGKPALPLVVGVFAEYPPSFPNPMGAALEQVFSERRVGNRRVEVRYLFHADAARACAVVFITPAGRDRLPQLLAATEGRPVLLVSDAPGFSEKGVHLNFLITNDRLGFELNEGSLRRAGLRIDPVFLRYVRQIRPGGGR